MRAASLPRALLFAALLAPLSAAGGPALEFGNTSASAEPAEQPRLDLVLGPTTDGVTEVTVPIDGLHLPIFRDTGLPWPPHEFASVRLGKSASGLLITDGRDRYLEVRAEIVADRTAGAPVLFDVVITARPSEKGADDDRVLISIEALRRGSETGRPAAPIRTELHGHLRSQ